MINYREELIKSLSRLADPPEQQVEHIKKIGGYPLADELAIEFGDWVLLADQYVEKGELTTNERDTLKPLDAFLEAMSGEENAHLWDIQALFSAPEWAEVRKQAKACLIIMSKNERTE